MAVSLTRTCKIRCRDWNPEKCYRRHTTCPASFLCRALGYTSMVGWAGAPQGAPVACNAGSSNPVQSTTMRLEPLVVGFKPVTGGCHYGYDPHSDTPVTCHSL
ncbi:ash family protein [Klebsiella variicola]|uniref:ash family protein n=1 Tax=Klebsiella variicola TaxID=244366 RepID=UPI00387DD3F2